ncbi:MAG: hypothetical protein ACJ8H8_16685 [Geminicoccaceae bacterium]
MAKAENKARMSFAAVLLISLGGLALLLIFLFELIQILSEGGLKLLIWPRLNHGYEVAPVIRLAVAPWALLLFGLSANGLCILTFGHNLVGTPQQIYVPWLLATIVPVLMIHLIDYRRSVLAAGASVVLIAAVVGYILYLNNAWPWLPAALPFLLWGLNGIRATQADRAMG